MACYSCGSKEHIVKNCPIIHYVVNREKSIQLYRAKKKQFFKSFHRNMRPSNREPNRFQNMMEAANKIQEKIWQGHIAIDKMLMPDYMQEENSMDYSRVSHIHRLFSMDKTGLKDRAPSAESQMKKTESWLSDNNPKERIARTLSPKKQETLPLGAPGTGGNSSNTPRTKEIVRKISNTKGTHGFGRE